MDEETGATKVNEDTTNVTIHFFLGDQLECSRQNQTIFEPRDAKRTCAGSLGRQHGPSQPECWAMEIPHLLLQSRVP